MFHTELEEYSRVSGRELGKEHKQRLQSSIASINTGAFAIGAILGPILSSMMTQFMSYRQSFMIVGIAVWVLSVPHFISQALHRRQESSIYKLDVIKDDH